MRSIASTLRLASRNCVNNTGQREQTQKLTLMRFPTFPVSSYVLCLFITSGGPLGLYSDLLNTLYAALKTIHLIYELK